MSTARQMFGACVIAGEIYVTGGMTSDDVILSSVEKYSPLSDTWSAVTQMPDEISMHSIVVVGSVMYVLGHSSAEGIPKFDSMQGTWSEGAPAPQNIYLSAAVAVGTDIYVFGGEDLEGAKQDSIMKYDTVADAWSMLAPMPHASSYHSASVCNGLVHIVGAGDDGHEVLRFDPASAEWSSLCPTLHDRECGQSFLLGGCLHASGEHSEGSSVERYDVATDIWTAVEDMMEERDSFCAVTIESKGPSEERDLFDSLIDKASCRQP
jgi:N-acetylneuraminic acid mutarotase